MLAASVMQLAIMLLAVVCTLATAQVNLEDVNTGCVPGGCSGNGECVDGVCVCNALWSSNSDFIIVQDCTLSIIAVYILWTFTFFICFFVLYKTAWVIAARFDNFFVQRRANKGYTMLKNPGLMAVCCIYSLGIPSVAIMAVAHFIDPTIRVGFDTVPTVLFFTAKSGLYIGGIFLQGPMLAVALRGERIFDGLIKFNHRFNTSVNIAALLIGGFPFITLTNFQSDIPKQFEVLRAYYFCQGIVLFLQFLESYLVKLRLNFVLKRATNITSSDRTASLLARVNTAQNTIIKSAVIQSIISITMGAVPYLLNKHAYFLPVSWVAIPLIAKNVALQVELDKKGTRTIAQRFKHLVGVSSQTSNNDKTADSSQTNQHHLFTSGKVAATEHMMAPSSGAVFETQNPIQQNISQVYPLEGMEEILKGENRDSKKKFADFVKTRYALDSLNFYDAVVEYENIIPKKRKAKGEAIIKRFILDSSSEAVDFPWELKQEMLGAYRSGSFTETTFLAAKKVTVELLKLNFYHKFKESQRTSL